MQVHFIEIYQVFAKENKVRYFPNRVVHSYETKEIRGLHYFGVEKSRPIMLPVNYQVFILF
jgi:hypothetical protein